MDATPRARTPWRFALQVVRDVVADLRARDSPVTTALVGLLAAAFAWQVATATLSDVRIQTVASYVFLEYPVRAWLLSFFLHRNVLHFGSNVVLIWFLGRVVEARTDWRAYLAFVALAAATSVGGGYLFTATFTDVPIAVYGASGLGFALATFALLVPLQTAPSLRAAVRPYNLLTALSPAEELAAVVGLAAVLQVALDLVTGPFFTVYWANGGHAVGALAGLVGGTVACAALRTNAAVGSGGTEPPRAGDSTGESSALGGSVESAHVGDAAESSRVAGDGPESSHVGGGGDEPSCVDREEEPAPGDRQETPARGDGREEPTPVDDREEPARRDGRDDPPRSDR